MSTRLQLWESMAMPDRIRLPEHLPALEILCYDSAIKQISNTGIRIHNCDFNSPDLQQLRRRLPAGAAGAVTVRSNGGLPQRSVWVKDPRTEEYFEVLNHDPTTNDLTAGEIATLEEVRSHARSLGDIITRAESRRRIDAISASLTAAARPAERRRAMKLLGLIAAEQVPPLVPRKKGGRHHAPASSDKQTTSNAANPPEAHVRDVLRKTVDPQPPDDWESRPKFAVRSGPRAADQRGG